MSLSKRLSSCLKFTEGFNKLADIGTDHALLPIAAIEHGNVSQALAIENKIGPFEIAYNNVKNSKFSDRISVKLGNGLEQIDDSVDVVVISGMGGKLISEILISHDLKNVKRFILQPNNEPSSIRRILSKIKYYIIDELIINEKNKLYDMIIIEPGLIEYNELQILFGPINLSLKPHFFIMRIEKELKRLETLLPQISITMRRTEIKAQILLLKEALK